MSKKKYKIVIFGHFGGDKTFYDGQTVKTLNLEKALLQIYGKEEIKRIDTYGGKKRIINYLCDLIWSTYNADNIVILPAQNGVRIVVPILAFIKKINRKFKIHYVVIGGWLNEMLKNYKVLKCSLRKIDYVYVETSVMKNELIKNGYNNIMIMKNFKFLNPNIENKKNNKIILPIKICTFSRVMKEKGIEDLCDVVSKINKENGEIKYILDIYGKVEDDFQELLFKKIESNKQFIFYKGIINPDRSTEIIKNYSLLIFPTRFYTEGIPGTIIDAYFSGVPVISSRWESCDDIVKDGYTGFVYEFRDLEALERLMKKISDNPSLISNDIRENCIKEARLYYPKEAIKPLLQNLV